MGLIMAVDNWHLLTQAEMNCVRQVARRAVVEIKKVPATDYKGRQKLMREHYADVSALCSIVRFIWFIGVIQGVVIEK